jgi:hypothetical protein
MRLGAVVGEPVGEDVGPCVGLLDGCKDTEGLLLGTGDGSSLGIREIEG